MKYIFLDFDGVLHGEQYNWDLFTHMDLFCDAIKPYLDNVRIVISSSWRYEHSLEKLAIHFHKEIRPIIIGVTPDNTDGFDYFGRYKEIKDYCKENKILDNQWIAIDDMARLFPDSCSNLILTNASVGLTPANITKLVNFINQT